MYEDLTASHYSAYRPPFHSIILQIALSQNKIRQVGLEIGCGTGHSAKELARYCNLVIGLEPSKSMLLKIEKHGNLHYVNSPGEQIPLATRSVDVVTLAGSLNYIDREPLIRELVRICRANAEIVVYDFKIDLTRFEDILEVNFADSSLEYDHCANLSDHSIFDEIIDVEDELSTIATPMEIAHILLSDPERHGTLCKKYNILNPANLIASEIGCKFKTVPVDSKIYCSVYSMAQI